MDRIGLPGQAPAKFKITQAVSISITRLAGNASAKPSSMALTTSCGNPGKGLLIGALSCQEVQTSLAVLAAGGGTVFIAPDFCGKSWRRGVAYPARRQPEAAGSLGRAIQRRPCERAIDILNPHVTLSSQRRHHQPAKALNLSRKAGSEESMNRANGCGIDRIVSTESTHRSGY